MTETLEFKAWLKRHDNKFRSYTPDQIAAVALACGFQLHIVCPSICDRTMTLKRMFEFWESPLAGKWMKVCQYNNGMEDAA